MNSAKAGNHLVDQSSPYLLQHAHNPVDWYPWTAEALTLARQTDRPILLSVGYSACHWCHVMAHESFEDEATANSMNELFVNVKVDREERPDIDKIYQAAHQLLGRRSGGWPLTVFLDPHTLAPFFTGTYFPSEARYNLPAFVQVLERVAEFYRSNKTALDENRQALVSALQAQDAAGGPAQSIDDGLMRTAFKAISSSFDGVFGGFGGAPKFPHTAHLELLLNWPDDDLANQAREMVFHTLTKMAEGGIYDQLGGGFCRYSVDASWEIPHFEKMLYDNGPLLGLFCRAWQARKVPLLREIATETAEWVMREMQSPEGGYYSSLDADSEGHEGKFYVWDRKEIRMLLNADEYKLVESVYGLNETPNFEGHWHLRIHENLNDVAQETQTTAEMAASLLASAKTKLLQARDQRVRPGLDDKILTSWNALMIKGMVIAGRVLQEPRYHESAARALSCIWRNAWQEHRLFATYKAGQARYMAYLDDYAFLLDACLETLQSRWSTDTLAWARELAEALVDQFADGVGGGFFFTAREHEAQLFRPKSIADESMPSGAGIAVSSLIRLGYLLGEQRYLDVAGKALAAVSPSIERYPLAHGAMLNGARLWLAPIQVVIVRGEHGAIGRWLDCAHRAHDPRRFCVAIFKTESRLPSCIDEKQAQGSATAFICQGLECMAPVEDFDEFASLMQITN